MADITHLPLRTVNSVLALVSGLKLKGNLMPGERIKSSMVQLPTSESVLVKFLAERNIDVIERAAAVK